MDVVWIIIIFAIIVAIIFGILTWKKVNDNANYSLNGIYIPFSGSLDPQSSIPTKLTKTDPKGNIVPQISCPAGTKVNIIGSISSVFDPYGQCSFSPLDSFSATCGNPKGMGTCKSSTDCPDSSWSCVGGKCVVTQSCSTDGDCGNASKRCFGGKCVDAISCFNLNSNFQNVTCGPNGSGKCTTRDSSAYLASMCDGKQSCDVTLNPTFFGPWPCDIPLSSANCVNGRTTSGYCSLPLFQGWGGGAPRVSDKNNPNIPASWNMGYKVHGLYTCVSE